MGAGRGILAHHAYATPTPETITLPHTSYRQLLPIPLVPLHLQCISVPISFQFIATYPTLSAATTLDVLSY